MSDPIIYALGCLGLIIAVVLLLKFLGITESATIVAVLILPLAFWALKSDIIQEISAPGGWSLKLKETALEPVRTEPLSNIAGEIESVQKEGISAIERKIEEIKAGKFIALIIDISRTGYYRADVILPYLQALEIYDPATSLILIDKDGRFVASAPARRVIAFLNAPPEIDPQGEQFTAKLKNQGKMQDAIGSGDKSNWLALPGFTDKSISAAATNLDALNLMDKNGLQSVITVDADKRPVGIAKRDDIVAHLVYELASAKVK
jgi:CBS domain-containing protein